MKATAKKVLLYLVQRTLKRMETECKSAWNYLKIVCRHDNSSDFEAKMSDFLSDAAARILIMMSVHKKVMKLYFDFLLWMGISQVYHQDDRVR